MDEDYEEESSGGVGKGYWGGYAIGIGIGIALGLFVFGSPKYEGENAEFWYNEYAEYEYSYSQSQECLTEIQDIAEFNSYGEDYDDMQRAFREIGGLTIGCID